MTGEEEVEVGGEEAMDEKMLTKRDIHTLNEQRRRDLIKVGPSFLRLSSLLSLALLPTNFTFTSLLSPSLSLSLSLSLSPIAWLLYADRTSANMQTRSIRRKAQQSCSTSEE